MYKNDDLGIQFMVSLDLGNIVDMSTPSGASFHEKHIRFGLSALPENRQQFLSAKGVNHEEPGRSTYWGDNVYGFVDEKCSKMAENCFVNKNGVQMFRSESVPWPCGEILNDSQEPVVSVEYMFASKKSGLQPTIIVSDQYLANGRGCYERDESIADQVRQVVESIKYLD